MKITRKYPIVVVREKKEYWAYIPDIPGIYGRGKSSKKAQANIKQAIAMYVDDCAADGDKIPVSLLN